MICKVQKQILPLHNLNSKNMSKNTLQKIEELILVLPGKDATLAMKFLKERNFEYILELVESDLYKANKKISSGKDTNDIIDILMELKEELITYMSYLDIPDNSDKYDYFI